MASRFSGPGAPYEGLASGGRWTGRARFIPEALDLPLRWRKPRRVFVNSMSDLFHEDVTDAEIAAVFGVMAACPRHTFQLLTKRPERMREWFQWVRERPHPAEAALLEFARANGIARVTEDPIITVWSHAYRELHRFSAWNWAWDHVNWPLPNVWLGVSAEDQARADERIPLLLAVPAAVRFVSCEPLIERVDLTEVQTSHDTRAEPLKGVYHVVHPPVPGVHNGGVESVSGGPKIDWVIVGGESGPRARQMDLGWARSIVRQCKAAGTAVFVKQLGGHPYEHAPCLARNPDPEDILRVMDDAASEPPPKGWCRVHTPDGRQALYRYHRFSGAGADPAEWPADLRRREFPTC
jgi:protein gp37